MWNSIGNITCSDLGINNRIEIRFTSTDRNKPEAFNDNFGFTMAALSYEGAVFASDPEEDPEDPLSKTRGSTVFYHAFSGQQHMRGANEVRPGLSVEADTALTPNSPHCTEGSIHL